MKQIYLTFLFSLLSLAAFAQLDTMNSTSLTAYSVGDTAIWIEFDYNKNCPEQGYALAGADSLGFHSGANSWASTVNWDAAGHVVACNDSSDRFRVFIDTEDYYGIPYNMLENIKIVYNQGTIDPNDAWAEGKTGRDSLNDDGAFGASPCSDLRIFTNQVSPMPQTSLSLLNGSCKDTAAGTISIVFDYSRNCPEAGQGLVGTDTLGFHSGANGWSTVVSWDDAGAAVGVNNGLDAFEMTIDPLAYYGIALDTLANIKAVFNNGPNDPANAWDLAGRGDEIDPKAECRDLHIEVGELPVCGAATSIKDDLKLDIGLTVAPNPFGDVAEVTFNNKRREMLYFSLTSITGQVLRTYQTSGNRLEIEKANLSTGLYLLSVRNAAGKFASRHVMVK